MGCLHAEHPVFGKVCVWPTIVGKAPSLVIMLPMTLEQNTPQTAPEHTIQFTERCRVRRVFEILKPAIRRPIDRRDDDFQAVPMLPRRLGTNRVFQLLEALVMRPTFATLKVGSMPFLVEIANGSMGSRHPFEAAFQMRLQGGTQADQVLVAAHLV